MLLLQPEHFPHHFCLMAYIFSRDTLLQCCINSPCVRRIIHQDDEKKVPHIIHHLPCSSSINPTAHLPFCPLQRRTKKHRLRSPSTNKSVHESKQAHSRQVDTFVLHLTGAPNPHKLRLRSLSSHRSSPLKSLSLFLCYNSAWNSQEIMQKN